MATYVARVASAPSAHEDSGLSVRTASAVRLLFAASPSLDGAPYCHFVRTLDAHVRERLTIPDVLEFLRMALEVPADEYLLLVPLINKAHRTNGSFGQKKTGKEVARLASLILS